MAQQLYGKNRREEPYAPSYGYNQVPKVTSVVETNQSQKKPIFINFYPSGNTSNPQRVIAQVETVTREVVRNPNEPVNHHGDVQSRSKDEFIDKLRDETMKATTDAYRSIDPKVLSTDLEQLQLSDQSRRIDAADSAHPNHPRKVAELMSRVSNWRGDVNASDYRGARPTSSDGYNINNGWNKKPNGTQGYDHMGYGVGKTQGIAPRSDEMGSHDRSRSRPIDDVYYTKRSDDTINLQAPRAPGGGYTSKPASTQQATYDDDVQRNPMASNHVGRSQAALRGGGSYTSKPALTQQATYDDDVQRNPMASNHVGRSQGAPRGTGYGNGYNSGMGNNPGYRHGVAETRRNNNGQLERAAEETTRGYGNSYSSGLPRSSYVERPATVGETRSDITVITSVDAVIKYKGTSIPLMKNEEQRKQKVLLKL